MYNVYFRDNICIYCKGLEDEIIISGKMYLVNFRLKQRIFNINVYTIPTSHQRKKIT